MSGSSSPSREIEKADQTESSPPDGGLRAWLVVVGGLLTYFCTFGLLNSFGTFQVYYEKHFLSDMSSSTISWIGTLQIFLLFIGGMFFGPIFDKKGSMILFFPGTLIYVLALMFTSLSTKYYQLILAQGIMFGIGDAMLFYPTISTMSHWFDKKRGLALGIVVAGSSLGGVAWPLILQRLFTEVGFGWTLRIVGFICLALLAPSCFLVVPRLPPAKQGDIPKSEFSGMFKDATFMTLCAGEFLVMWGMFIPFYYLPLYALSRGVDTKMSNDLISILNAGSLAGRVVSGYSADKLGKYNITLLCALCSGIVLMCMEAMKTEAAIIVFAVLYGFFSGGLISLQSACIAQITTNMQMIGVKIGVLMSIASIGVLTGSPIGGALVSNDHGSFVGLTYFSGAILLAGAAVVGISRMLQEKRLFAKV